MIDGHRRIKALDLYYKYDGTTQTDYSVKVEAVAFDEKTEKEQMTYEALGNTKADYHLVAEYIGEIDYTNLGLSDEDLTAILSLADVDVNPIVETFEDFILPTEEPKTEPDAEEKKEAVKEMKAQIKENAIERNLNENAYITLSFSTHRDKAIFCELLGISEAENFAKGEDVLSLIE